MRSTKQFALAGAAGMLALTGGSAAQAYGSYGDGDGDRDSGGSGRASSYINPDTGAATANPDVDPGSNCFSPDQYDRQAFSPTGAAAPTAIPPTQPVARAS